MKSGMDGAGVWNRSPQLFNILVELVFTIPGVGAPFTKLMENTPKRDSGNTRSFPDCNFSFLVKFGGGFYFAVVFIIFKNPPDPILDDI